MRRDLQLMGSRTENQASAEAPSLPEVLGKASYCEHTVEPNTRVFVRMFEEVVKSVVCVGRPLNIPCWPSLTAERIHDDHHRF